MPAAKKSESLESLLKKLEDVVDKLESKQLSLEDSLKIYSDGVTLTKKCHAKLSDAEKKIQILNEQNQLVDFDEDDED